MHTTPGMTCSFLIQLVFYKKKTMWLIGAEVEQETSAPPPKKNPGSAPVYWHLYLARTMFRFVVVQFFQLLIVSHFVWIWYAY